MIEKFKEILLNIINLRFCPFCPEDSPFPQDCDKRIMFTDECKKRVWRNVK